MMSISVSFFICLWSFVLFFNLTLFYLDDFKLSQNKYIRFSQNFTPLFLLVFFILYYFENINNINNVVYIIDKDPKVNIGASIEIGKDAATEISKGISSLGSNIGLAATVGSVTAGVSKVVCKTSLPPLQKAGIVVAGSAIGGAIHVGASALNKLNNTPCSNIPTSKTSSSDGVSKLLDDNNFIIKKGAFITCFAPWKSKDSYYENTGNAMDIIAYSALLKRDILLDFSSAINHFPRIGINKLRVIYIIKKDYDNELREDLYQFIRNNNYFSNINGFKGDFFVLTLEDYFMYIQIIVKMGITCFLLVLS